MVAATFDFISHLLCSVYAELGINEGDSHIIRNAGGSAYVAFLILKSNANEYRETVGTPLGASSSRSAF